MKRNIAYIGSFRKNTHINSENEFELGVLNERVDQS